MFGEDVKKRRGATFEFCRRDLRTNVISLRFKLQPGIISEEIQLSIRITNHHGKCHSILLLVDSSHPHFLEWIETGGCSWSGGQDRLLADVWQEWDGKAGHESGNEAGSVLHGLIISKERHEMKGRALRPSLSFHVVLRAYFTAS